MDISVSKKEILKLYSIWVSKNESGHCIDLFISLVSCANLICAETVVILISYLAYWGKESYCLNEFY